MKMRFLNKIDSVFGKVLSRGRKLREPIFIVGCGRSGTTLLFDIVSQHPGLARTTGYPDGEDHSGWIEHGRCVMAGIGNASHSDYGSGINGQQYCLHMTKDDVTEEIVRDMHDYYWKDVLKECRGKRVVNKQPHLSNKLDYVLGIFPDAKIVHIVRDCEPMVASWLALMDEHPSLVVYWPLEEVFPCFWLMPKPKDVVALACLERHSQFFPGGGSALWIDYWCKVNLGILRQMQGRSAQLLTIRYEDLVSRPKDVLYRITSFCNLESHDFSVDHLQTNTANKHTDKMTPDFQRMVSEQARPVRAAFGYCAAEPSYVFPENLYIP